MPTYRNKCPKCGGTLLVPTWHYCDKCQSYDKKVQKVEVMPQQVTWELIEDIDRKFTRVTLKSFPQVGS